jgi:hypothetical protein
MIYYRLCWSSNDQIYNVSIPLVRNGIVAPLGYVVKPCRSTRHFCRNQPAPPSLGVIAHESKTVGCTGLVRRAAVSWALMLKRLKSISTRGIWEPEFVFVTWRGCSGGL